jgi:FixJ family two-component response regulator
MSFARRPNLLFHVFIRFSVTSEKPIVAVIEDDPDAAEALALILRDWGAEVMSDISAAPLFNRLGARVSNLSCIIADYDLGPGPDGVAAAKSLAASAPEVRVLVLSGAFRGSGLAAARAAGFDFMAKPARPSEIIDWLEGD